jgi:hypothetical protein
LGRKSNTFIHQNTERLQPKTTFNDQPSYHIEGPYSYSYTGLVDFDENLLMDDLDLDEIIECDDIEQTAIINSSRQLLNVIDNMITSIDDRINYKRHAFYG